MSRVRRVAVADRATYRRGTVRARRRGMRNVLVIATLLAFGCGQLRYASRTEMVEVAADPAALAAAAPPRSVSVARARTSRTHALLIGGAIASVIGIGFIVGGAV